MGTVEKRTIETRSGKELRYYARWRTPNGQSRIKTFARKRDAENYLTTVESGKLAGDYFDPAQAKVRVGEWVDLWLGSKANLAPKTRERYEGIIREHIKPKWSRTQIGNVRHSEVQAWVSTLTLRDGEPASPATVRKVHRVLSQALDWAVKDGRLPRNPAASISLPRVSISERRYLSHAQVELLAEAVGEPWRLLVLFLAYTGLRWGEAAALKVNRLDLLRRRVIVAESVTPIKGVMTWGPTKGNARREVGLPLFLAKELETHLRGLGPSSLLFAGPRGGVMRAQTFQRAALNIACEQLGLCEAKLDKKGHPIVKAVKQADGTTIDVPVYTHHLHPHELRHTAASLAIASGADVKVIQQMLGHKSAIMTLDLYGHLFPDRLDAVAEAMEQARERELGLIDLLG